MDLQKNTKQFILYVVVGGIATVVEWGAFYCFNGLMSMNYAPATILAFAISTFANWAAGRLLMFQKSGSLLSELGKIYLTSIAGLLMNLAIMWVAIDLLGIGDFTAKVIATGLVFFWNFLVRKLLIYKV